MNKNRFVFVITSKDEFLYPSSLKNDIADSSKKKENVPEDNWKKIDMEESVKTSLNSDKSNLFLDNAGNFNWQFIYHQFDSSVGGSYEVYVVPCLAEEKDFQEMDFNKIKCNYLENVVKQISGRHSGLDISCFYLIAHEKDFNTVDPDVLATSLPDQTRNYPNLQNLVTIKHVYLFQHEDSCSIYSLLRKLICLSKDTCNKILNLIDKAAEMIWFFQKVNNNTDSSYKKN